MEVDKKVSLEATTASGMNITILVVAPYPHDKSTNNDDSFQKGEYVIYNSNNLTKSEEAILSVLTCSTLLILLTYYWQQDVEQKISTDANPPQRRTGHSVALHIPAFTAGAILHGKDFIQSVMLLYFRKLLQLLSSNSSCALRPSGAVLPAVCLLVFKVIITKAVCENNTASQTGT